MTTAGTEFFTHGKVDTVGNGRLPMLQAEHTFDLDAWLATNKEQLLALLGSAGAVLLRGFPLDSIERFERLAATLFGPLLDYTERSSPRSRVNGKIYTSTEYPAEEEIFFHNENSYQRSIPLKIAFYCAIPPSTGGETPLVDVRRVTKTLPEDLVSRFREKGIMYVRNFGDGFGLPWQSVFQTDRRQDVDEYCRRAGIHAEWKADGGLRTRQIRPAFLTHPATSETIWCNHATFFHITTLPEEIRMMLTEAFSPENLPNNSYYGDGSPIPEGVVKELRAAYRREEIRFPWQARDCLLLDNLMVAHGRAPFKGERKIVVAMAQAHTAPEFQPS